MARYDMDIQANLDPPEYEAVICPICGDEAQSIYRDWNGDACGCDKCVDKLDAYDWKERNT